MSDAAKPDWEQWKGFCENFEKASDKQIEELLPLFFNKSVAEVIQINLTRAWREKEGQTTYLKLKFVVNTPDAWEVYKHHEEIIRTYIKGKVSSAFNEIAQTADPSAEPLVKLKYIKAERGTCGLEIALIAVALKYAPLVGAAAATVNAGIGIYNLWRSLRTPKPT